MLVAVADAEVATWVTTALETAGHVADGERVDTLEEASERLRRDAWDLLVLGDVADASRDEALRAVRRLARDVPVVAVCGSGDVDAAVQSVRAGATEVALVGDVPRLGLVVTRALRFGPGDAGVDDDANERLAQILDAIPTALVGTDALGRIVLVNVAGEELFGWRRDELIGQSVERLVPPGDREAHGEMRRTYLREPATRRMAAGRELFGVRRDGTLVPIDIGLTPISTPEGPVVLAAMVDLTKRRAVEDALAREAEREAAMAEVGRRLMAAGDTHAVVDALCEFATPAMGAAASSVWRTHGGGAARVAVSRGSAGVLGTTVAPAIVDGLRARLAGGEVATLRAGMRADEPALGALAGPEASTALCTLLRRGGGDEWGILVVSRRPRHDPFEPRHVTLARDLTRVADLALANAGVREELARVAQLKSEFVATLSHELRTPLTPILGYLEMVLDGALGALTPSLHDALRRVERNARDLYALISATLDLGRLEAGLMPIDVADVALAPLLEAVAENLPERETKPGVVYTWDVAPGAETIRTDGAKLAIVLRNLVQNAFKFTDEGAVVIEASCDGDDVVIDVRDTGIGISSAVLPSIFEAFRQGDASTTRRHRGVGLGLYLTRRLLERLGGRIDVDSVAGRGTTVRVRVPPMPSGER